LDTVCNEIIMSLTNYLHECIDMIKSITPFVSLQPTANIKKIHKILVSDIDLTELAFEYKEILNSIDQICKMPLPLLYHIYCNLIFIKMLV